MAWSRTVILILLTLVAMTLPVSARSDSPCSDKSADTKAHSVNTEEPANTDEPAKPDDSDNKSKGYNLIAPNTDVWDAGVTRAVGGGSGPALIVSLLGNDVGSRLVPADHDSYRIVETPSPVGRSMRPWLACRYAHAPPKQA